MKTQQITAPLNASWSRRALLGAAAASLIRPARAAPLSVLRFVPGSAPAAPDPLIATPVARCQSHMIWDTLFGQTAAGAPAPQMVAAHSVSEDLLVWRFTLRPGLRFHDNSLVTAKDCVASIRRWGRHRVLGIELLRRTDAITVLDDRSFELRLHQPYPLMLYALGSDLCFVLPEALANQQGAAPPATIIGSGPFRYHRGPDGQPSFERFAGYIPAPGPADFTAGGKRVLFDQVDWIAPADPALVQRALQRGDIDWWHGPAIDTLPALRDSPGIRVAIADPTGTMPALCLNHLQPPFNNARLRRALLLATDQDEFLQAAMGSEPELTKTGVGIFTPGTPFASEVGLDVLTSPRDIDLVRRLVTESGYRNETIVLLVPSDIPRIQALAQVAGDLFERIGLVVERINLEWTALLQRRTLKDPTTAGGWSAFCTTYSGLATASPANHLPIGGGTGDSAAGWTSSKRIDSLRDAWFDAADLPGQQTICRALQRVAWEEVPYIPLGQWFTPSATRTNLSAVPRAPFPVFWGVGREG